LAILPTGLGSSQRISSTKHFALVVSLSLLGTLHLSVLVIFYTFRLRGKRLLGIFFFLNTFIYTKASNVSKASKKFYSGYHILGRLNKSKSRTQTLRRRSWKWWFRHYNDFNVKAFLWLKRLWRKKAYVLRPIFGFLNLAIIFILFWLIDRYHQTRCVIFTWCITPWITVTVTTTLTCRTDANTTPRGNIVSLQVFLHAILCVQ